MVLEDWPIVPGRYYTGNKNSCVAVCTLASIDLLEKFKDVKEIAITGKAMTENIGIEKIVQNVVTNPNIRFLILCGEESYGHYVGQAILSLAKNGVDDNFNIIGAEGPMAMLKNLTRDQIENFRNQIKVINLIGCEDMEKILNHVNECEKKNPGPFEKKTEIIEIKPITAWHDESKDVVLDPKGFFTIFVDQKAKQIVVEHYIAEWDEEALKSYSGDWKKCMRSQKLNKIIVGKRADDICHTIIREGLLSRPEHAAYLGRELQKAEIALKNNLPYEQG